jgi:anhydro-N-acetylmuramic acid kinase
MNHSTNSLYVGAMSGTSVDGLDLALVDIQLIKGALTIKVIDAKTVAIPLALRDNLLSLGQPKDDNFDQLGACDNLLGQFIGESISGYLDALDVRRYDVAAIGSHGQTIRHRPPGTQATPFTLQIGDPNSIAEVTGITTVADFRRRDVAAGGQGAPLTPAFHKILFGNLDANVAVLNIGGISNLTLLSGDRLVGFDTGPGNGLIDQWCKAHKGAPYDDEGAWGASGKICDGLLRSFLDDPYFALAAPKSTGREYFNQPWLEQHLELFAQPGAEALPAEDVQATLVELTAQSIAHCIAEEPSNIEALAVCGGGRLNKYLMQRLAINCNLDKTRKIDVQPTEHWGVDGDSLEAAAFAWLAYQRMCNLPGNMPSVTGAKGERVLGAIFPG